MKIAVLLLCLLSAYSASAYSLTEYLTQDEYNAISVNANKYIDNALKIINIWIVKHGMDPLEIEDIEKGFSFKIGLIKYHGELTLKKGWLQGLSTLTRKGDCFMTYEKQLLNLRLSFTIDPALISYDYSAKLMNIGPKGGIEAKVKDLEVFVDVMIDTKTTEITLQNFKIKNAGHITLKFSGNPLLDWITNILTAVSTEIFHGIIKVVLQVEVRDRLQKIIDEINANGPSGNHSPIFYDYTN